MIEYVARVIEIEGFCGGCFLVAIVTVEVVSEIKRARWHVLTGTRGDDRARWPGVLYCLRQRSQWGKLKEADTLLRDLKDRAPRPGPAGTHPAAPQGTQPEGQEAPADPQQPEDRYGKLLETIQFGDPAEAKTLLQNTIEGVSSQIVQQQLYADRLRQESEGAKRALGEFSARHADIAADPLARAAVEAKIFELQREDLESIGVDLDRLRDDGNAATPADIAAAHRHFRAMGHGVRTPAKMLEEATLGYQRWRGQNATAADPASQPAPAPVSQPAPNPGARVEISIERGARRQAASPQPSRTSAPRPQPASTAPRDRSTIVAAMAAQRAGRRASRA